MRGEQQGQDECLLATLADLTKTPLSVVRETALAFTGKKTWAEVCDASNGQLDSSWWKTIFYLCDIFDDSKKLAYTLVHAHAVDPKLLASVRVTKSLPAEIEELPTGKGVIVLGPQNYAARGHVVPWEDGLTFDTNVPHNYHGEKLSIVKMRYYVAFRYFVKRISQL